MLKKLHSCFTLLLIIALFAFPILAQESTPEATETPAPVTAPTEPDYPLDYSAFSQIGVVATLSYFLMEVFKKVPALKRHDAFKLNSLLTLVLFVGYQVVVIYGGDATKYLAYLGDAGQFAQSIWNIFLSFAGSTGIYHIQKNVGLSLASSPKKPEKDQ